MITAGGELQPRVDEKAADGIAGYWRARVFLAAWIAYAGFYFCRKNIQWVPLPSISKHAWLGGFASLLVFFSLGYIVGQFVGGCAADRYGGRRPLVLGALLSVSMTALMTQGLPMFLVMTLQTLNGLGQGFGWPALMKLLSIWLPRRSFAIGMAWWSTSYALGSFLATAVATLLSTAAAIPIQIGLRLAMLVPAAILLITTLFFLWWTKGLPASASSDTRLVRSLSLGDWKEVVRSPRIRLLSAMYFFLKLTRYSLLFWLPVYLIEMHHTNSQSATILASLFELSGFVGTLLAAYMSDRLFGRRRYPVGSAMLFLAALIFLLYPFIAEKGTAILAISFSALGLLIFGSDVLMASTAVLEAVSSEQAGRASGLVNGVGSLGQLMSPLLVTLCVRRFGWNSIFDLFFLCSLIAASLLANHWSDPAGIPDMNGTNEAH